LTSTILAGTDVVYSWDLGDGTNLSGQNVDYIYPALGVYTATLTATNSQNVLTDTTTLEIVIPVPISDLSATNDGPLPVDTPVRLEATVTAGTSIDYFWDYGDGETGTGRVKDHAYSAPGFYTAVVTATNTENSMTAQTNVEVVEQPECQQFEFGEDGLKTNFYLPYVENFDSAFHLDVDTIKTNAKLSAETSRKLHISVHVNDELVLACSPTVLPEAYYYLCSTTADFKLLKNENIKYTIGGEGSPIGSIEDVNFLEFCTVEQDSYLYLPGILR
jgi:PKD repeat protein